MAILLFDQTLKILDSVKQSSKEVKFELNGDGEGITECIGYVLSDEKQNYEKSFIEGLTLPLKNVPLNYMKK